MKVAGWTVLIYAVVVWIAGVTSGDPVAVAITLLTGLFLLACGRALLSERMAAAFGASGAAMLLGLFFGYRFISMGDPVGGVLLVTSFLALFVLLLGVFIDFAKKERSRH